MRRYKIAALSLAAAMTLGTVGCSAGGGGQESTAPAGSQAEETGSPAASGGEESLSLEASQERLMGVLAQITQTPRASGTAEEQAAAEWIELCFKQMGYETRLEAFHQSPFEDTGKEVSGANVVAVRKSDWADINPASAEIIYITAHHDSKPGVSGAVDDASGVSVLLETAALISQLPTDREVRFVSFSGEEDGRVGSRYHVENLTEEERSRIVGVIQLDELGYNRSEYLTLCTVDGEPTMLGDRLSQRAAEISPLKREIAYEKGGLSDHNSFHTYGIEAAELRQDAFAFENHTTQDRIEILDPEKLTFAARLVAETVAQVMSDETESLISQVYGEKGKTVAWQVQPDTIIPFAMDRNHVENTMGLSASAAEKTTNEFGDAVTVCTYPIRWFGMEEPLETEFQYRRGYLDMIEIPMAEAGYSLEDAKAQMADAFGDPMGGDTEDAPSYDWADERYHKFYTLQRGEGDGYQVLVMDYQMGKEILSSEYLRNPDVGSDHADSVRDRKMYELVEKIVYPEDRSIIRFSIYTDGKSNSTGYTSASEPDDNTFMEYGLDYADAMDEEWNYQDYNKMLRTAIHEYGHVLSLNSGQVNISAQDPSMPPVFYTEETYKEDAYIPAYYRTFWEGMDVKTGLERYQEQPGDFVSYYAASNLSEDFAESFAQFVLGEMPDEETLEDSIAAQKIWFFYDYEEMTQRRNWIRQSLGLDAGQ